MLYISADFISNNADFLCNYFCWIFRFNDASRILWLSIIWFLLELLTRIVARRNKAPQEPSQNVALKDDGSWGLIALSSALMCIIILSILHFGWSYDLPTYFIPIGILLMFFGVALRLWAVNTLGKFFTMKVMIFSDHQLIEDGPYRWLRHPSYTGVFLTAIGFGLATGYSLLLITFLVILSAVLGYRIYVEEKALKEEFGPEWTKHARRTWRLIPWLF